MIACIGEGKNAKNEIPRQGQVCPKGEEEFFGVNEKARGKSGPSGGCRDEPPGQG